MSDAEFIDEESTACEQEEVEVTEEAPKKRKYKQKKRTEYETAPNTTPGKPKDSYYARKKITEYSRRQTLKLERKKKLVKEPGRAGRPTVVDMGPSDFVLGLNARFAELGWSKRGHIPYELAQIYVQTLGIKNTLEYRSLRHYLSGDPFLPVNPYDTYKDKWNGWGEFLGNCNVFPNISNPDPENTRDYWSAVRYVRTLGLKSTLEWNRLIKTDELPPDIPKNPKAAYGDLFGGYRQWLGTEPAASVLTVNEIKQQEYWAIYSDGRPQVYWWARLTIDTLRAVKTMDVEIIRIYEYEAEYGDYAHNALQQFTRKLEDDDRERFAPNINDLLFELDSQLMQTE